MIDPYSSTLGILIFLFANGLFSAARSAFVNASRPRLRQMAAEGVGGARWAATIAEESTVLLTTLRVAQTFCRFAVAALVTLLVGPLWWTLWDTLPWLEEIKWALALSLLLLATMVVVGLGEFLPEALARRTPEQASIQFAPLVMTLQLVLAPATRLIVWVSTRVAGERAPLVTEEEIKTLVDAGEEGGAIEEDEKEMIYSILDISETWAREVMVPRIDVVALEAGTPLSDAVKLALESGHSRIPVYDDGIDHILGMLYVKDLLRLYYSANSTKTLRDILRPAHFIPETKLLNDLLAELQQKRIHMAIVVDEYGGTAGIVTLEDIVEQIVGDIRDEYDVNEETEAERVSDHEYLFDARINLDDVNKLLKTHLPTDDSDTLGGFIYSQLGHVPIPGEKVATGQVEFEVLTVKGRSIRKVRAVRPEDTPTLKGNGHTSTPSESKRHTGPLADASTASV